MKLSRREFGSFAAILILLISAIGCPSLESIITTAGEITTAAAGILAPVNIKDSQELANIAADLNAVEKTYQDYEKAEASLKPGKAALVEATVIAVQNNLTTILADVRIKNPEKIQIITVAVSIAATALQAILNKLPSSSIAIRAEAKHLPTIPNAKSANDLKKAWNAACKADYPGAMVK